MTATPERPLTALDVIFSRRSIRAYESAPLDEATVRALLSAAVQAPTAMHAEPWSFVVVRDRALLDRYSTAAKQLILQELPSWKAGRTVEQDNAFAMHLGDPAFNIFYDAPVLIVICAPRAQPFAAADCWLAAENLMLAAAALGLGTCCIGSALPLLHSPAVKADLQIPDGVDAIAPLVVGVPREAPVPSPRKEPDILCWR
jgi:nitroreductase